MEGDRRDVDAGMEMETEKNESFAKDKLGLTTTEALEILGSDIRRVVDEYEANYKKNRMYMAWLKDSLHHCSQYTTLCWTSSLALLLNAVALIALYFVENEFWSRSLLPSGIIVCCLVSFNFFLVACDNKLRHHEILNRVKILLEQIENAQFVCNWNIQNYPHLCSPLSPCLTLQWTYRDGQVVNLPWALLVTGDVIVIKPGQQVPGHCIPYNDEGPILHAKEVYSPPVHSANEIFSNPKARTPLKNKIYKLQETPYLTNLRMALDQALDRPVTYHNRERHLVMICCIEQLAYPIILIIVLLVNLLRHLYLSKDVGIGLWTEMFLLQPIAVTLPLLPLVFPAAWLALNCFGMARFKALFKLYQSSKKMQFVDPFEDADISGPSNPEVVYNWSEVRQYFVNIFVGREHMMSRSANILHVLGSVTALCCVDKKGILSWPNPTAEKVFFLRNASTVSQTSSNESMEKTADLLSSHNEQGKQDTNRISYAQHDMSHSVAEVLDLTHDHALPFRLEFDDHAWKQHINSLKPLGLAILLNTCNMDTQEHYTQFCSHVTCEALYNENLVPVTNRRCLCELAKQIGFQDQAQEIFKLEEQLSTFKHVQPEMVRRDIKFARSLSLSTKLKFPFPHMVSVVVRERSGGGLQLLAQGTADLILDSCIEFWDGHDLCPLSASDRKKVQDFYQRTSLTSYCTAFAYRPLTRSVNSKLSEIYLEIPTDSKHLYTPHRSPTPLPWDFRNVLDPRVRGVLGQFHSTDSLLCNENKDEEVNDIEGCFDLQCNQIFIGMVTMQYQAQTDMVQLIEQLERACIRFVHFSKENELRSRVFSEKMGLESGWNCHISLLSERARSDSPVGYWVSQAAAMFSPTPSTRSHQHNHSCMDEASQLLNHISPRSNLDNSRAMSMSAPSAINTEFTTVKFDDETTECNEAEPMQPKSAMSHREQDTMQSEDSVLVQSVDLGSGQEAWRSLSCLTDSTEQSAPVNFDMSNRAKLPRGIDKIRPHIELIDNVPLLVSLFTDCNTVVTREMLHIMQDYGEVVCVLGSSANAENMPIFMQADAGVAVEPLYPQVCQKVPVMMPTTEDQGPSPVDLSRTLNSISCSLSIKREDPIALYHLVMEARHYMQCVWNCVQFWICCVVTLSMAQLLSSFLMLPPLFSVGQVLWLSCLIIPLLSVSLVATPTDPTIMQRATGKNQCLVNGQVALFVLWCYGSKFLPTVITVVLSQGILLANMCYKFWHINSKCVYVYPQPTPAPVLGADSDMPVQWGGWGSEPLAILLAQHFALVLAVLHFVTISISFVHREYSVWRKQPIKNWTWVLTTLIVLGAQAIFSGIIFWQFWTEESKRFDNFQLQLPLFFLFSVPLIFAINELVKWQEIKANVRYQKRARLEFGTKLGMNSPF
ncbi:transmembrane protein 94 isoform X1 [Neodiprion fabricii]|uniref:transmembrane protein 94 isoform X1 n=1 Tax=Neodiprion fabricii TaxID=2872261 RepID=UPI001ED94503|nr:transmembrane protein 94 isoform X1 [Neodiprion fabricii]XP_046427154.1 transmembrane protein 94 isoform X1 [Neodiprion fabricii]